MSTKFTKGTLVWVKHPVEAWKPATVGEILSKAKIKIFYSDGSEEIIKSSSGNPLLRMIHCEGDIEVQRVGENEDEDYLFSDDLTKMSQLITPAVLHTLHKSYKGGRYYSKLGSGTVLALNPFKDVPGLFTLKTIQSYHSVSLSELQHLPAHVYAAAQSALVSLRASVGKVNQSIIVSGESGAGKTWTVRCLMRYLAEVGIEYKRRLSSTDMSSTPLKGFHVTPIRASMKTTIYEVSHGHGKHSVTHSSPSGDPKLPNGYLNDKEEEKVIMTTNNDSIATDSISMTTDDNISTVTDRKLSSSYEEIFEDNLNLNVNNNNEIKDQNIDPQGGAGDSFAAPKQSKFDENKNLGKVLDFGTEDEDLLKDEDDDILEDMDETVEDLNTSIQIVDRIERRILHSNPILEAFGNAHTLRNENSSRFGKYIQLQYDRSGTIVGAQLRTYLLEKTRAVRHDPGERSYHIFYQMFHGATDEERDEWKLPECPFPEDGRPNHAEPSSAEFEMKQKSDFLETRSSMLRIGISTQTQELIFKLLSAVLHLRQLTFEGSDDLQNPCTLEEENELNKSSLQTAAELLGVHEETIMQVITFREITAHSNRRKSVFHRPSTVEECNSRRDSLVKLIYEILFHWIVERVGDSVCAPDSKWCNFIGLLDVYGFESFENNSLEQLCINYANEKLQQHFVSSFLREQQEEYTAEGVAWTPCDLTDNVDCLLALESPRNSLFSLLNEECRLNRARAGGQLKSRVESMFHKNKYIIQPRISTQAPSFSVVHYAGQVSYRTEDLIEKNKDEIPNEITQLLASSGNKFVFDLFNQGQTRFEDSEQTDQESSKQGKHRPTVLTRFKKSLDDLLDTLGSTDCHYIRCIKPNKQSVPDVFDAKFVLSQLEACGVVETIRVCAPAHPNKLSYNEFLGRYGFLLRRNDMNAENGTEIVKEPSHKKRRRSMTNIDLRRDACDRILKQINKNENEIEDEKPLQYGKTMIFLSSKLFESLESSRSQEIVTCTVTVQRAWRGYVHRMKCRAERKALIAKRENAATVLQRNWTYAVNLRKCREERRKLIIKRFNSAVLLQRCWLMYRRKTEAKKWRKTEIRKKENAAVVIQKGRTAEKKVTFEKGSPSVFRGWRIRCKYKDLLDAWRQLKLLPEQDYRRMVEKRLRILLGPEPSLTPSPTYEAIRASFEMPVVPPQNSSTRTPSSDSGYSQASCTNGNESMNEKLTVYYDETTSKNVIVKENVIDDDLEPYEHDLHFHLHPAVITSKSPIHDHNRLSGTSSPKHDHKRLSVTSSPMRGQILPGTSYSPIGIPNLSLHNDSMTSSPMHNSHMTNSSMHDSVHMTTWKSDMDLPLERLLHSGGGIRHAKLVRSCTSLDKVAEIKGEPRRSTSMPKIPRGPGVIYAWHNRAVISMMTSKRPMSLSSDPMTLIEMQYNESSSVLTTPFSSLRIPKRSQGHRRRVKHRHSDRHARLSPPQYTSYSWSPTRFKRIPKSGSNCILKYADVPPKTPTKN
ncbi:uncharacterized protein LOC120332570 isoform X1 [Styela clava]